MTQAFSVTWIDIAIVVLPFLAIGLWRFVNSTDRNVHKAVKVLLHPASLLVLFVVLVLNVSHF